MLTDWAVDARAAELATSYVDVYGRAIDLSRLTPEERAFFVRCWCAYHAGSTWVEMRRLVEEQENPLIRATGGWITPAVWHHPLFQAVRDLENRRGIDEEMIGATPDMDLERNPLEPAMAGQQ